MAGSRGHHRFEIGAQFIGKAHFTTATERNAELVERLRRVDHALERFELGISLRRYSRVFAECSTRTPIRAYAQHNGRAPQ
jgi:hypothetical protein